VERSQWLNNPKPHLRLTAQIAIARFGLFAKFWPKKSTESVERSPDLTGSGDSPIWRSQNDFRRNSGELARSLSV
jgi:hypothetical protein